MIGAVAYQPSGHQHQYHQSADGANRAVVAVSASLLILSDCAVARSASR
jgi:hypothetical protein